MAYWAVVDSDNEVLNVIVADQTYVDTYGAGEGCQWIETYTDGRRGNFAGRGDIWHPDLEIFTKPKPFPSWVLDGNQDWQAPVAPPVNSTGKFQMRDWSEVDKDWIIYQGSGDLE